MFDLFHEAIPQFDCEVFGVIVASARSTRFRCSQSAQTNERILLADANFAAAMRVGDRSTELGWPLPNVWLGVSVESQKYADERIPLLLQTPAAVRFLSVEPMLEAVDLQRSFLSRFRLRNTGLRDE